MPTPGNVFVAVAALAVGVLAVAATFSAIVVHTWDTTHSAPRTLFVAVVCTGAYRLIYVRYRSHQARKWQRKYTLPYIRYHEGGDGTNL